MASPLDNLLARRSAICQELADLTAGSAGGQPNTNAADSADHVGYKDGLYRELREINEQIAAIGGPAEVVTYGRV